MLKSLRKFLLVWLLCAGPVGLGHSQTVDSTNSTHSAHVESADDQAYRIQQRHRLGIIMSALVVAALVYVMRKQRNSPTDARV